MCFKILPDDFFVVGIKTGTGIGMGIGSIYGDGMLYNAMGHGI